MSGEDRPERSPRVGGGDGVPVLVHHDGGVFVRFHRYGLFVAVGVAGKRHEGFPFRLVQFPHASFPAGDPVGAVGETFLHKPVVDVFQTFSLGEGHKEVPSGESHESFDSALFVSPSRRAETAGEGVPGAKPDKAFLFFPLFSEEDLLHRRGQVVKDHYGKDSAVIEESPAEPVE